MDVLLSIASILVMGALETWLSHPQLPALLPYLVAQLALMASAWRLRKMGAPSSAGLRMQLLKLSVAMTALITPLFTLSMMIDVSGLGGRHSVLHGTALEPVMVLGLLALSAIYPALLLRHILAPAESRWDRPEAVARVSRSNALAIDLHLVLSTAWLSTHVDLTLGPSALVSVVAITGLYTVIALPRFAIVASRFDAIALISACLFVLSRVVHTVV